MSIEKLMNTITESADMGVESLGQVINKTSDPALIKAIASQREEYKFIFNEATKLARERNISIKKASAVSKVQSGIVAEVKSALADNRPSAVAEMVIQGSTMGVTKMTADLNAYTGDDHEVCRLAEKQIKTEQANIDQMKQFL